MVGQGVELRTEDRAIAPDGTLGTTESAPHPAAAAFAHSFTEQFPAIAAASPVYAELRNVIDLAIVAAWLRKSDAFKGTEWQPELFYDESRFAIEKLAVPRKAACVAKVVWNGNRMLLPAGGGVSILADEALRSDRILPPQPELSSKRRVVATTRANPATWWWD
jgi:hypothetical protein